MTIQALTQDEIAQVSGGVSLGKALQVLRRGRHGWPQRRSGRLQVARRRLPGRRLGRHDGRGTTRQAMAGMLAGAAFGPYAGSSGVQTAANYENGMDRQSSHFGHRKR